MHPGGCGAESHSPAPPHGLGRAVFAKVLPVSTLETIPGAPRSAGTADGARTGRSRLCAAAVILLGSAPLLAVLTYRSLPLVCGVALLLLAAGGDWRGAVGRLRREGDGLWTGSLLLMLGVALLSLGWSVSPGPAARDLAIVGLFVVLGALAWASSPPVRAGDLGLALGLGMLPASLLILWEMRAGMALHAVYGGTTNTSKMNQGAVLMAIWLWPALAMVVGRYGRWAGLALLLVAGAGIMGSHSETARLAFRIALVGFAFDWIGWRRFPLVVGAALAAFMVVQPWLMGALHAYMPQAVLDTFKSGHAAERLTIWTSFSYAVQLWPFAGVGFDGSGLIGFGPRLALIPPELQTGIRDSHPHNMYLQVWVELGLLGALPLALFLWRSGVVVTRLPWRSLAPCGAAVLVTIPVVALVGYGAWQAWWIAAVSAVPVLFAIAGRDGSPREKDSPPAA